MEEQARIDTGTLDARIEALLFASGGTLRRGSLPRLLGASASDIDEALETLTSRLTGGIVLIETEGALALRTAPSVAETVSGARRKDWEGELGQAGLEVIAIVLHKKQATRSSIDYIRGVNSASTLRILETKGLVERSGGVGENEALYRATPALLSHLGVTHVSDIPGHAETIAELEKFEARKTEGDTESEADEDGEYDDSESTE